MRHSIHQRSRQRFRIRDAALALLAFLFGLLAVAARAQPVAVVVDKAGEVTIDGAGAPRPVASLDMLDAGSRIRLVTGGRLVLLYMQSGHEYSATGPALLEVEPAQLKALQGAAAVRRVPPAGQEIRLRPDRVALGGIVLRSVRPADSGSADKALPTATADTAASPEAATATDAQIEQRRPAPGSPFAARVAYALWLDDVGATAQARAAWRALSAERPADAELARRAP
jgi:hypothetical protein